MIKVFLGLVVLVLVGSGCAKNYVYMNVTDSAPVSLAPDIKNVGIVKRCRPSDSNKSLNKLHKMTAKESDAILREGSDAGINGLHQALLQNNRFTEIKLLDSISLTTPGAGIFPTPLTWAEVEKICKKNNIHALFSLEMFDTELRVIPVMGQVNLNNPVETLKSIHQVNMTTFVKTGWRIYYPTDKRIVDETSITKSLNFTATGANPIAAIEALMGRKEAIKQTADKAGREYSVRILPVYLRVTREYFIRAKSHSFTIAKRRARTGNWDGAAQLWLKATNSSRRKTAGRACHNMAIISEINGDIDTAISWASKAYEDYRIRLSLEYLNVLRYRRTQIQRLEHQQH